MYIGGNENEELGTVEVLCAQSCDDGNKLWNVQIKVKWTKMYPYDIQNAGNQGIVSTLMFVQNFVNIKLVLFTTLYSNSYIYKS